MKHKEYYNDPYIQLFSERLAVSSPDFDPEAFSRRLTGQLDGKELFARIDCITDAMEQCMGCDSSKNIQAFFNLLGPERKGADGMFSSGWWLWPISRYVERHGNEHWELSLSFLKELTKRFTGEYAIRPLLKERPAEVMEELLLWTKEQNVHVRRLAGEGVRIRLPWSQKLFAALLEFEKYCAILTNLKDDPEKFVQKSIGNNLNDLYKEAPEKADFIIAQWKKTGPGSKAQEWIIKHGTRNQV